tara:strand:- start:2201 stop:2956 length:756 start_codon:yes stop_codon:yes gene_type:complete
MYFLRNVYKDPKTGHKVTIMQPPLALGQVVHEVIESLSTLPVEERLKEPLLDKYKAAWEKVSGKLGGFKDKEEENVYKGRGEEMIKRVIKNPGIILNKAVKINQELPYFWFSEEDNLILCGKIDWLEYIPEGDSVHIVDFKTGKADEDPDSLQLPIYLLLATNCQKRKVAGASYWYLDREDTPKRVTLPSLGEAKDRVLEIAKKVALARKLGHFNCSKGDGCPSCLPFERVLQGKCELVGESDYRQDIYIV